MASDQNRAVCKWQENERSTVATVGAKGCSHGCSEAKPVEIRTIAPAPEWAEESRISPLVLLPAKPLGRFGHRLGPFYFAILWWGRKMGLDFLRPLRGERSRVHSSTSCASLHWWLHPLAPTGAIAQCCCRILAGILAGLSRIEFGHYSQRSTVAPVASKGCSRRRDGMRSAPVGAKGCSHGCSEAKPVVIRTIAPAPEWAE